MSLTNLIIGKFRRYWVTLRMALFYRRWTPRRGLIAFSTLSIIGLCLLLIYHVIFTIELLPWNPRVDKWCDYEEVPDHMLRPGANDMTIVTMFLNLGTFKKGEEPLAYHSHYKYKRWMRAFGKMVNKVVAYIEEDADIDYFREVRACLPASHTKIIKVQRNELSSFQYLSQIKQIYALPSYPKYHPDTMYPEYTCAMNAKYDVLQRSCLADYFETPFFAWVDIGLFRNLDGSENPPFKLVVPEKFHPERVGFSQAWPQDPAFPPEFIMKNRMVYVSGSMVLAEKEYMLNFTKDYQEAVKELLAQGLSSTDQQVIYSMYSAKMRKPHYIKIKPYICQQGQLGLWGPDSRYFCLGYVCKNAWEKRVPNRS